MKTLEEVEEIIKQRLSEKRYLHSKSVMENAIELARIYRVDENILALVGIAHDIAKEIPTDKKIEYCQDNNIQIEDIEMEYPELLHAKIGADIVKKEFGFSEQMANAIKYHTTGKVNMDMVSKIIFVADSIADDRKWKGVEEGRQIAKENLDEAVLYFVNQTIKKVIENGELLHIDSVLLRNEYIKKLRD